MRGSSGSRAAVAWLLLPGLAMGQTGSMVATVERVTESRTNRDVSSYPTELSRRIAAGAQTGEDVFRSMAIRTGDSVLTRAANTHIRAIEADRHAFLYANTYVTFDSPSVWLLGRGGAFLVNSAGKLTVLVEGLARLIVNSEVYVRVSDGRLLVAVVEGAVTIEGAGAALILRAGQFGRVTAQQTPLRFTPDDGEAARIRREIDQAKEWIRAPSPRPTPTPPASSAGGGGKAALVVLGLGAMGAGIYLATREKTTPSDLVIVPAGRTLCGSTEFVDATLTVLNQGMGAAPPSSLAVVVQGGTRVPPFPVPALAAGQSAIIDVSDIFSFCEACTVTATVDPDNAVEESNEANNSASGLCT